MASPDRVTENSQAEGNQMPLRNEPIKRTIPRNNRGAWGSGSARAGVAGREWGAGAEAVGRRSPHHPLQGIRDLSGLVQKLTVLQLLAEPLQRVQWFVQLHRHGHFGQVLPYVISQDVPHADVAGVRAGCRQASSPFGLGFPTTSENRLWKGNKRSCLIRLFTLLLKKIHKENLT